MVYKNKKVLLDNFRDIFKDFSVDVQDVVRSAILDEVDITNWIDKCADNPYRLDQIRLCKKEGIDNGYLSYKSGEVLRGIRGLIRRGVNLSPILKYDPNALSDRCFLYLIVWCKEGYKFSEYNFSIVPDYMLEFFDFCIRRNINVTKFNTGIQYTLDYLDLCLKILGRGMNIDKYSSKNISFQVLNFMEKVSSSGDVERYNQLYSLISSDGVDLDKLELIDGALSVSPESFTDKDSLISFIDKMYNKSLKG